MEAIARSLGIIEDPSVQNQLEALFDEMVARTIEMRQPASSWPPGGPAGLQG